MSSEARPPHFKPINVIGPERLKAEREIDRFASELFAREGPDVRPHVLALEWRPFLLGMYRGWFEKEGYGYSAAQSGRIMLAKARLLRPDLIVTGLNVLYGHPPAYRWMMENLERPDGVPVLLITAAIECQVPDQFRRCPRARYLQKPIFPPAILKSAAELLALGMRLPA
jgi:CheY-like chemotaxis protein